MRELDWNPKNRFQKKIFKIITGNKNKIFRDKINYNFLKILLHNNKINKIN